MINIIICDDNLTDAKKIERIVKRVMTHREYKIHMFHDYNKDFLKIVNADLPNKIYLLDIETPSRSGIDIARKIRKNDFVSVIIFLTGHDELGRVVAKKNLMCLNFINKFDNLKENLTKSLELALLIVGQKRIIHITSRKIIYNIDLDKILYVTHDTVARKTIIVTDIKTYHISISMNKVISELPSYFVQVHRSCYANSKRIDTIDIRNMCITFDNGMITNTVSKRFIGRVVK